MPNVICTNVDCTEHSGYGNGSVLLYEYSKSYYKTWYKYAVIINNEIEYPKHMENLKALSSP